MHEAGLALVARELDNSMKKLFDGDRIDDTIVAEAKDEWLQKVQPVFEDDGLRKNVQVMIRGLKLPVKAARGERGMPDHELLFL